MDRVTLTFWFPILTRREDPVPKTTLEFWPSSSREFFRNFITLGGLDLASDRRRV